MNTPLTIAAEQIREHGRMLDSTLASGERAPHERAGPAPVVAAVATGSVSLTYEQLAAMLKQCKSNVQGCPAEAPAGYYALDDQEIKVADACWHSGMDQLENEILNWAFDELRASRNTEICNVPKNGESK